MTKVSAPIPNLKTFVNRQNKISLNTCNIITIFICNLAALLTGTKYRSVEHRDRDQLLRARTHAKDSESNEPLNRNASQTVYFKVS